VLTRVVRGYVVREVVDIVRELLQNRPHAPPAQEGTNRQRAPEGCKQRAGCPKRDYGPEVCEQEASGAYRGGGGPEEQGNLERSTRPALLNIRSTSHPVVNAAPEWSTLVLDSWGVVSNKLSLDLAKQAFCEQSVGQVRRVQAAHLGLRQQQNVMLMMFMMLLP
jgi:hypothetical protein